MKRLRVTARIDLDAAPPFYRMLATAPEIAETRLLEWNATEEGIRTVLFAICGDAAPFAAAAPETASVESVTLSAVDERWTYALAEIRPTETGLFEAVDRARTRPGLVVRKPIVYRDGDMHFGVVGESDALQAGLADAPAAMGVQVDEIGTVGGPPSEWAARLSERQRAAVVAAVEGGYYERPRAATHEDVAAALDCAPSTASEHLRKAEAKLVRAWTEAFCAAV